MVDKFDDLGDKIDAAISNAFQNSWVGNIINTDLIDATQDIIGASLGQVSTTGSPGSFLAYNIGSPFIYAYFYTPHGRSAKSTAKFGNPYEGIVFLNDLKGFTICKNASITYSNPTSSQTAFAWPTADEQTQIVQYLNTGVFIE